MVLQNRDLENCEKLFAQFDFNCANTFINDDMKIPLKIAIGFARFDPSKDMCFADVFKRADDAMYENKRKIKTEFV